MSSNFLSALGSAINSQFGMSQSAGANGEGFNYSDLGGFEALVDKSAYRTYIESGTINNIRPSVSEVLFQQPEITVLVKKKMFSSLIENSKTDILEEKERALIRATKKLFSNKCKLISAYERLSKIERFTIASGSFNTYLLPSLLAGVAEVESLTSNNIFSSDARIAFETLRKAVSFGDNATTTTWITDFNSSFQSRHGEGTGIIELTNFSSVSTSTAIEMGKGSAKIDIEDPYGIMVITNADIDKAISESYGAFQASGIGQFVESENEKLIQELKVKLNKSRLTNGRSPISFFVSLDSLNDKVRAIIDFEGRELVFSYDAGLLGAGANVQIDDSEYLGKNGLSKSSDSGPTEEEMFKDIIENIFLKIGFENSSRNKIFSWNSDTSYIRNRMRLFFANKCIVNSMDVVYVFMTTKTKKDDKISLNVQTESYESVVNSLLGNINDIAESVLGNGRIYPFGGNPNSADQIEKAAIVGPNFPTWLWRLFRNDFTKQGAGTSVFVGLAKEPSRNFQNGKYTVSINCGDNSEYLDKGQINIKPSLDVYNSVLYDPLTPFDISFDAATGASITSQTEGQMPPLLPENERLLSSAAIRFKNGRFRGQNVSQVLYRARDGEVVFGNYRQTLSDPNGFVYRWKQGIGTLTFTSRASNNTEIQNERSPLLTKSPFAGQDSMNIISLLITGQPYNYNTFVKSALNNLNSVALGEQSATSYIEGLSADLMKKNSIWGGFVPFKSLSLSDAAFQFIKSGQADLTGKNRKISELTRKKAELIDRLAVAQSNYTDSADEVDADGIPMLSGVIRTSFITTRNELQEVTNELSSAIEEFQTKYDDLYAAQDQGTIAIYGDDITVEPGFNSLTAFNSQNEEQRTDERDEFRLMVNKLTQRLVWKVRGNLDVNLFVVDDQYDKNFDIMAFERKIESNLQMFNSDYVSIKSQISSIAKILGLEVFCDTQGNIVARPPKYNMVPSSVLKNLFKIRAERGVKLFPDFLETLFFSQIQGLCSKIEIVEDEIRLRLVGIGVYDSDWNVEDRKFEAELSGSSYSGAASAKFKFASSPVNGSIGDADFRRFLAVSSPEENNATRTLEALEDLDAHVSRSLEASKLFDVGVRANLTNVVDQNYDAISRFSEIRKRLERTKGIKTPAYSEMFANNSLGNVGKVSAVVVERISSQISRFVAERQNLLRSLKNAVKNLRQGVKLNNSDSASGAVTPFLSMNADPDIPKILEHMVEYEDNHDIGEGSGKRFIIRDENIVSFTISENAPEFTAISVNGLFGEGFTPSPTGLALGSSGNAVTSAYAVDYDMWYQYGFNASQSVEAPFFTDPDSQCAPYAVSLLNIARKNILRGTVNVSGHNEFYQPGDVVYLESQDLLFYVTSVSHNFTFSSLSTTLQLAYGHNPGEYIPTHLDVVGKILYNSKGFTGQYRSLRFDNQDDGTSLGAIIIPSSTYQAGQDSQAQMFGSVRTRMLSGPIGERNRNILNKIILASSGVLSAASVSGTKKAVIEIRAYRLSEIPFNQNAVYPDLKTATVAVKDWLKNPAQQSQTVYDIIPQQISDGFTAPDDSISVVEIDLSTPTSSYTPSSAAIAACRELEGSGGSVRRLLANVYDERGALVEQRGTAADAENLRGDSTSVIDQILVTHVLDIFLVYQDIETSVSETSGTDQASQQANQQVEAARNR